MRHIYTYLFAFLFSLGFNAQPPANALFLKEFYHADRQAKIKLTAAKNFSEIAVVYPLIRDTLNQIRRSVYADARLNAMKFSFDQLDAGIEMYHKNYAKAIFILENCLRSHCANINDSLRCLVRLKNLFIKIKNYNKALELYHVVEQKWPRKSDTVKIGFGMGKSGIYFQIGLNQKAVSERRREFNAMHIKDDTNSVVSFYNDMGVYFNAMKNSDSAEVYFVKAKQLLETMQYPAINETYINFFKALVDGNLGLAYYNCGRVRDAIPLLKKDVYYSLKSGNFESAMNSYLLLVRSNLDLKDKGRARLYLDSARVLVNEDLKENTPKLKFLLMEADYARETGDYQKSSDAYREYLQLNNKQLALENDERMKNENVSLSVEQKEAELTEKDNLEKQRQLEDARQRSYRAYLFTGILVLLAIMAFLIQNNYTAKKREEQLFNKNLQISSQKLQIEQSLKEKETLIKEIHHRVKNNLQIINSMLSLQIAKVEDEKTSGILRDARQRISSIALTHQMLYQKENLSNIDLGEYLETLVRQIEFIMPASGIKLVTDIRSRQSRLTIDNAVPLGLLVNELLTNSYKHAFPKGEKGKITVTLTEDDTAFTLTVGDNGIGLPHNFKAIERKTLGMELIYILADQLDARLDVENTQGSTFRLYIKKTQIT